MCGIAGVYGADRADGSTCVRAMVSQLVHRGPDGEGFFSDDNMCLGMTRLAIIDPEHGQQPLYNERRDVVVVFNGEIYNHQELRVWLKARGHRLESGSDGAIVPHLYEELGEALVDRLNGIFAIALWDRGHRSLHLFRDRFGVKPLYWSQARKHLTFASELKALLCDPEIPRDLDEVAIDQFLTFRFIPSPRTMLKSVQKLSPGSVLTVDSDGVRERRYWRGGARGHRRDRRMLIEEYREAFERAVVRQMMSDRPIGVMLSGGVDSGAITAVLAAYSPQVRTFTIGFAEGGDTNEVPLAEETARLFATDHYSMVIGHRDYLARLPESLLMVEEPVGTTSALALNYVAELMRPYVPVALCGQGADEPLGGYRRHLGVKLADLLRALEPAVRLAAKLPAVRSDVRVQRELATIAVKEPLDRLMAAYRLLGDDDKRRLYRPAFNRTLNGAAPQDCVERFRREVADLDPLGQMLYVDTRLWLPDELLLIADKMSMAASVELRVPFLDQDLVALVESMHSSQKVRGLSRKSIHKRAMLKWLPARIVYRRERGWATPMARWLRHELRPLLVDVVLDPGGLCRRLFEEQELRRLIETHGREEADLTRQLFCLLSLGLWERAFVRSSG